MHSIPRVVLVPLHFLGLDVSITNEVVLVWVAGAITVAFGVGACRNRGRFGRNPLQQLFEALVEFVRTEVFGGMSGGENVFLTSFVLTLFFFILFANLISLVPAPTVFKAATSNINVTAALAVMVFVVSQAVDVRRHGAAGYLRRFSPSGVPGWLAVLVVPIEIVSRLARPFSLALRLFANMVAGHAVIFLFLGLAVGARLFLAPLPLAGAVLMQCFEVLVALMQAFIFALLTGLYLREALEKGS